MRPTNTGRAKRTYIFSVLGKYQALKMDSCIYQGTIWKNNLIWNHQRYICTNKKLYCCWDCTSHILSLEMHMRDFLLIYFIWYYQIGIWIPCRHRWELPVNHPFSTEMVIYHYFDRIWRALVTPFLYIIYDHKKKPGNSWLIATKNG